MEITKTTRILRLLMLLTSNHKYTLEQLMGRYKTSARTIYRDLDDIEVAGFVLERDNGYRLVFDGRSKPLEKLLHFNDEEVEIIYKALESINDGTSFKERLLRKLHTLYNVKALESKGKSNDLTKINQIRIAIEQQKQLILKNYSSSHSGGVGDRIVEPFGFTESFHGLWVYELKSKNSKQFKIARIESIEESDVDWQYADCHKKLFTDIFRMSGSGEEKSVQLILSLKAYNLLIEEYPLAQQFIKQTPQQYLFNVPVVRYEGVGRFVLGLIDEIIIIGPTGFKEYLQNKIQKHFLVTGIDSK